MFNSRPKNNQILSETNNSSAPTTASINNAFEVQNLRGSQCISGSAEDNRLRQYESHGQVEQQFDNNTGQYQNVAPIDYQYVVPVEYQHFANGSINNSHREYESTTQPLIQNTVIYKPSPTSSSSSCFCRICHEGDNSEPLVAPCKCTGTVALIHTSCLEHWLTTSNSELCEICKFSYKIVKEPRSCAEYLKDSSNQFNVRNLIADVICFFLLTPLLIVSTYLCALGANEYFTSNVRWEAVGLIVLSFFLLGVYFTWCHVTMRFHISMWKSWQRTHQQIRLVEMPPPTVRHSHHGRHFSPQSLSPTTESLMGNNNGNHHHHQCMPFSGQNHCNNRQPNQFTVLDEETDDADTRRILIV